MIDINFRILDGKSWRYMDDDKPHYFWQFVHECDSETRKTLGQFTGLKDKENQRVYEGDILKDKFGGTDSVWFRNARFGWDRGQNWGEIEVEFSEIEIIGNVWENSELINSARTNEV